MPRSHEKQMRPFIKYNTCFRCRCTRTPQLRSHIFSSSRTISFGHNWCPLLSQKHSLLDIFGILYLPLATLAWIMNSKRDGLQKVFLHFSPLVQKLLKGKKTLQDSYQEWQRWCKILKFFVICNQTWHQVCMLFSMQNCTSQQFVLLSLNVHSKSRTKCVFISPGGCVSLFGWVQMSLKKTNLKLVLIEPKL